MTMAGMLSGIFSMAFIAIAALVIAIVALVYALGAGNSEGQWQLIPFASGLQTGGSLFGTGAAALGISFGSVSFSGTAVDDAASAAAFVAPFSGTLKSLFVNFSAFGDTGAVANVSIYISPKCNPACGDPLVRSKLGVRAILGADITQYCLKDTCHKVKVRCGDRIALVATTALDGDIGTLLSLSGSVILERTC